MRGRHSAADELPLPYRLGSFRKAGSDGGGAWRWRWSRTAGRSSASSRWPRLPRPVTMADAGVAVVISPLAADRTVPSSGPWIALDTELATGNEGPAKG